MAAHMSVQSANLEVVAGGRCSRCGCSAFTLVELLVVIAIIGVLIGLIFPVFAAVKDKAWEAECQSNLRQIGMAIETFRQKNNRNLPRAAPLPSGDPFSEPDGLNGALRHIIDPKSRVYLCPADHDPGSVEIGTSYFYVAGAFMFLYPPDPYPAAREITRFLEGSAGQSIPLLWDSDDRHFVGPEIPRNGLFMDGRARRIGEPFSFGP